MPRVIVPSLPRPPHCALVAFAASSAAGVAFPYHTPCTYGAPPMTDCGSWAAHTPTLGNRRMLAVRAPGETRGAWRNEEARCAPRRLLARCAAPRLRPSVLAKFGPPRCPSARRSGGAMSRPLGALLLPGGERSKAGSKSRRLGFAIAPVMSTAGACRGRSLHTHAQARMRQWVRGGPTSK